MLPTSRESVSAVMVTHNGAAHIEEQINSMLTQTRPLDHLVIVDDNSTDDTTEILTDLLATSNISWHLHAAPIRRPSSVLQRIAQNFVFGIHEAVGEIIILADQDDIWHTDRVEVQSDTLAHRPSLLATCNDGRLMDERSLLTEQTIRDSFPVPPRWWNLSHGERVKYTMKNPVATGAAMALRPANFSNGPHVPPGWLHDRWFSLTAVAADALHVDPGQVIDYRVHPAQVVGMSGSSDRDRRQWLRNQLSMPGLATRKLLHESVLGMRSAPAARRSLTFPLSLRVLAGDGIGCVSKSDWEQGHE